MKFLDYFSSVEDPRQDKNKLYPLEEVLLVVLCAKISGADGWEEISIFGRTHIDLLREYLPFKNGVGKADVFRRLFARLSPDMLRDCFLHWMKEILPNHDFNTIAIDGKQSRRSHDGDQGPLHMVSAFASEARLVLGQQACAEKSNEITAIPELLKRLDVSGHIVTIDAMGCQKKIAQQIFDQGGHYIFGLKENQKKLFQHVSDYFQSEELQDKIVTAYQENKGHGRHEKRRCNVIDLDHVPWLYTLYKDWSGFSSIIQIQSERTVKGKTSTQMRYYISSLPANAECAMQAIRDHWGVENSLHWVLDMCFNDDQSRIRKDYSPQNMAIMNHFAVNMIKNAKITYGGKSKKIRSIKSTRKAAGWDDDILRAILNCLSGQ